MKVILKRTVLWEECFEKELCVKILGKKHCESVHGCVRIVHNDNKFLVEMDIEGGSIAYELAKTCYPAWEYGLARINVCIDDVDMQQNDVESVTLSVEFCIGFKFLGKKFEKCWNVIKKEVLFYRIASSSIENFISSDPTSVEFYANIERDLLVS